MQSYRGAWLKALAGKKHVDQGSMPMDGGALIQEYIYRRKLELWRKLRKERDFVNDDSLAFTSLCFSFQSLRALGFIVDCKQAWRT